MIIALIGKAYTGKSSIARVLEEKHGFVVAGFSDYLKELTCQAVNTIAPHRNLTVSEIHRDKEKLRRLVQEFGAAIGFDTDPQWIKVYIDDLPDEVTGNFWDWEQQPCVIDCLRSEEQVQGAREMGAKVVGVDATLISRFHFAGHGSLVYGRVLVERADEHPIDGSLDLSKLGLDMRVINDYHGTAEDTADEIAYWVAPLFAQEVARQKERMEAAYGEDL